MTALLAAALALALLLMLRPSGGPSGRIRRALTSRDSRPPSPRGGRWREIVKAPLVARARRSSRAPATVPLTVVVQQLAALLKGGRTPSRLWDELWLVYAADEGFGSKQDGGPRLTPASLSMLAAARAAATRGSPVADALRAAARAVTGGRDGERRIWGEIAACFDIAEASGCPLADVLTRFAAQLEVEEDAEAARQTALAGPKATVTLLTWLPLLGLGLGVALGVDPLSILLGTPFGMAALAAGVVLTIAGRIWSARLVRSAIGIP
jgi:tight adherence protein B